MEAERAVRETEPEIRKVTGPGFTEAWFLTLRTLLQDSDCQEKAVLVFSQQ